MRTKKLLQNAKSSNQAQEAIKTALEGGWTPSAIRRNGSKAVVKALAGLSAGVAQPQVAYVGNRKDVQRQVAAVRAKVERTPERAAPTFTAAERINVRLLRDGKYSLGHMLVNPGRAKRRGEGLTHDVLVLTYEGQGAQTHRMTLSETAIVRLRGGEQVRVWLDEHSYMADLSV